MAKLPQVISEHAIIPPGSWACFKYYGEGNREKSGFLFHASTMEPRHVSTHVRLGFSLVCADGSEFGVEYLHDGTCDRWNLVEQGGERTGGKFSFSYPVWLYAMLSPDSQVMYGSHLF